MRLKRRRAQRDPLEQAWNAQLFAERLENEHGKKDKRVLEAFEVAADAYEAAGEINRANHIRLSRIMAVTGKGYGYGISPPHGIFTKGTTMAYVKEMVRNSGSHFFDRSTMRFFGGDTSYGPYVGPGGVFFVQANRAGISVREVFPDWHVSTAIKMNSLDEARKYAQNLAKGKIQSPLHSWRKE